LKVKLLEAHSLFLLMINGFISSLSLFSYTGHECTFFQTSICTFREE
jgi:hypothetical protein